QTNNCDSLRQLLPSCPKLAKNRKEGRLSIKPLFNDHYEYDGGNQGTPKRQKTPTPYKHDTIKAKPEL
ncbi:hypothetical protein, partial [Phyllobacterium sp. P5_D12]